MDLNKQEIDKAYVSEHDLFLHKFDKDHPAKSKSQQAEINKHKRIYAMRDEAASEKVKASIIKKLFRVFFSK